MKKLITCATLFAAITLSAAEPTVDCPIFITIGQSNADGSGFFDEQEDARLKAWYDSESNPQKMKIWYRSCYIVNQADGARHVFDGTVTDVAPGWLNLWYRNENTEGRTAMNMIHGYGTWSTGTDFKCAQGRRGMEGEFGLRYQTAFPDRELYIIKLGCSGSAIASWSDINDSHNWSYFYHNIFRPAIESLLAQGKRPRLAGIWWMQGCGDQAQSKEYYYAHLKRLIEQCRIDLGFADATVYIGHVIKPGESELNPTASVQFGQGVRDAQDAAANPADSLYIPNTVIIDGRDCPMQYDQLHWNHVGVNRLGDKIADQVIARADSWAEFSTPGAWFDLDTDHPTFAPSFGNPVITYVTSGRTVTATLDYGTWQEQKTITR